jgi:hypothetical protein
LKAQDVLAVVLQLLALFPTVEPAIARAIADFQKLFADGNEPTQADIDALLDRVKAQSAVIQSQPD